MSLKYVIKSLKEWVPLLFGRTPFVHLKGHWYFGKIAIGVPYFYPRYLRKKTDADIIETLIDMSDNERRYIKENNGWKTWLDNQHESHKFVQAKWFKFDYVRLGWKTKWDEYRFEWNPGFSLVLFNKQLNVIFKPDMPTTFDFDDVYWEGWLTYNFETDKKKPVHDRLIEFFNKYGAIWKRTNELGKEEDVDYMYEILKPNYHWLYSKWKTEREKDALNK